MSNKHNTPAAKPEAVDVRGPTQPAPPAGNPLAKPAEMRADEAANAMERTTEPRPAINPPAGGLDLDVRPEDDGPLHTPEVSRLHARIRDLQSEIDARSEYFASAPPRRVGDVGTALAALCDLYRISQAVGGERRQRYLDAAMKAGDALADDILGPPAPPAG